MKKKTEQSLRNFGFDRGKGGIWGRVKEGIWGSGRIPFTSEEEACEQKERVEVLVGQRSRTKGPDKEKVWQGGRSISPQTNCK